MPNLHLLKMDALPKLGDAAVGVVQGLGSSLRWLSLAGADGIRSPALSTLTTRLGLGALEHLCLARCEGLDDEALGALLRTPAGLCALPALRCLRMGWCYNVSARGLAALATLRHAPLTELDVSYTKLDDAALERLAPLTRLRVLVLRGCAISDIGVGHCSGMVRLRRLDLRSCDVGNNALRALANMVQLRELDVAHTEVGDAGLLQLAPLAQMRALTLDSCRVTNAGLQVLPRLPCLASLDLSDSEVPQLCVVGIVRLRQLTHLNLFCSGVNDASAALLGRLAKFGKLRSLNLDSRGVTDAAMPAVATIGSLTHLDLFGARITDVGLKHIAKLRRLRHLELCGGGISDAGVARLGGALSSLRTLNLSQNLGITDRAIPALAELPVLESLNLSHTQIGAAGLACLRRIPSLTSLALHGCEAAPPQAALLRAALPRLVSLGLEP